MNVRRPGLLQDRLGLHLAVVGFGPHPEQHRAHFERLGFAGELAELDGMRSRGAARDEIVDAFPEDLMRKVGYYGRSEDAAEAFTQLAKGLDIAIVRVVAARPGADSVLAAMRACRPGLLN